jgi:hypothetical protein
MHSRRSFFMRGGSVVGAVLVVALLSAAAVMIDSSSSIVRGQLAQSAAPSTAAQGTVEQPKELSGTCQIGYDYVIKMEEGKPVIYAADAKEPTKKAINQATANRCANGVPSEPTDATGSERWCQSDANPRNTYKTNWHCKVRVCKTVSLAGGGVTAGAPASQTKEKCFLAPKTMEVGKPLDASSSVKETETNTAKLKMDTSLTPQERLEAAAFSSPSGTCSDCGALLQSFSEQTAADIKTTQSLVARDEQRVAELKQLTQECAQRSQDSYVGGWGLNCEEKNRDLNSAEWSLAQNKARLAQLQEQSKSLQPTVLCVTSPCPGDTQPPAGGNKSDTGNKTPGGYDPGSYSGGGSLGGGGSRSVFSDFFGGNTNQLSEVQAACRAGNQQACQSLAGGGQQGVYVSSGYGATGGQSGCNSNSGTGGGGIFGTIISLVMKGIGGNNSSGCNSGSNTPSPTCTITATPRTVAKGQAVTLSWQSERGFSATLSSSGSVAPSGSMTVNPQTTTTYTLQVNGYIENRTGQQLRGQCSTQVIVDGEGGGTGAPKAEISCRPEVADVGMQVAVSFACANSVASSGNGFSTNNQMSGSATPTVAEPTIGTTNAIFGVTCSKDGKTDTAQCTIAINKTSMVLIANPKNVESGAQANVGWVTSGMQECTISSPTLASFTAENAGNTATSGVAKTPVLVEDTEFELTCTTKSGDTKSAKTTVVVD